LQQWRVKLQRRIKLRWRRGLRRMTSPLAGCGTGIGWRPEIAGFAADLPGLRFTEVVAESLHHGVPQPLSTLVSQGVTVVPHGVKLSVGSASGVEQHRIAHLAWCAEAVGAPIVSEHVAFVRAGGLEAGHLLPVPHTREALDVLARNVKRVMDSLPVPFALEPVAALFRWPDDELTEAQFVTELLERTGAYLLLDVANVYANALNRGEDPLSNLEQMPLERVAYLHVAGGRSAGGYYHDTHTDPVPDEVLALLEMVPNPPAVLLERDGRYPAAPELRSELDAIAEAAGFK
jgi:uncharacterized protein (UPF0276 family)